MLKKSSDCYDAIIVGAGIGGLVCGCYLAKAGMKVLLVERHVKPGGYCTSFRRRDFTFDAAAHSFGGYSRGKLGSIFKALEIDKKIVIKKFDPSDTIITHDQRLSFWADLNKTVENFQAAFPAERSNIKNFFNFLIHPDIAATTRLRGRTFQNLLDGHFHDVRLKSILSFPVFGNSGLSPSLLNAYIGAKVFAESLLDGGHHPESGMQALPDALAERFREFGGELLLSRTVKRITTKENAVAGVVMDNDVFVPSNCVVSNCDARQTFFKLLGNREIDHDFLTRLKGMTPSLSMFILYLGLDEYLPQWPQQRTNAWFLPHYDLENAYWSAKKGTAHDIDRYIVHFAPERKTIVAFLNAPFKSKRYWDNVKSRLLESFIENIEKHLAPSLTKHVAFKEAATPHTLFRYTLNYRGAAYGWEGTTSQFADYNFRKPSFIRGLYLTGHWTTLGHGIPGVTYSGWDTAHAVIKNSTKKKASYVL